MGMEGSSGKRNNISTEAQTSMHTLWAGVTGSFTLLRFKDHRVRSGRKGWSVRQVPVDIWP